MENKNSQVMLGLILGIVIVSAFLLVYNSFSSDSVRYIEDDDEEDRRTISVSGFSNLDVSPDQSEIFVRVEFIDLDPKLAQSKLNEASNNIIRTLKSKGLSDKEIETVDYNLERFREWKNNKYIDKGYRASHSLKLTIKDLTKVGEYINLAINNGANNIENVRFTLSEDKENDIKNQLLSEAAKNAKSKADLLAKTLNSEVISVVSISESSRDYGPVYAEALVTKDSASESPVIQPKSVSVTVSVSAVFEIA